MPTQTGEIIETLEEFEDGSKLVIMQWSDGLRTATIVNRPKPFTIEVDVV